MSARVIAVVQQKGGAGKSTTVVELACAWGVHEKPPRRVLVIDMDAQAGSTRKLGLDTDAVREQSVIQVLERDNHQIHNSLWRGVYPGFGIDIVPAHIDLEGTEAALARRENATHVLAEKLANVRDQYDFIVIDTRPSLGMLTLNALFAAEHVVIPVNLQDPDCKHGTRQTLAVVEMARDSGHGVVVLGALATFQDTRMKTAGSIRRYVTDELGIPFLQTWIPKRSHFANAGDQGVPVNVWRPAVDAAFRYRWLAEEIDAKTQEPAHV